MLQFWLDGSTQAADSPHERWRELLDSLEHGEGPARRVVTAVRFAGVDEPSFREPVVLDRPLGGLGVIDVETCTVDELFLRSARAAYASIAPLKSAAVRIGDGLMAGAGATATRDLPALVRSVQTLATITAGLAGAHACAEPHRSDLDALVLRICRVVDGVVTSQASARWAVVADVLDRELVPTLDAWVLVARRVWRVAS